MEKKAMVTEILKKRRRVESTLYTGCMKWAPAKPLLVSLLYAVQSLVKVYTSQITDLLGQEEVPQRCVYRKTMYCTVYDSVKAVYLRK